VKDAQEDNEKEKEDDRAEGPFRPKVLLPGPSVHSRGIGLQRPISGETSGGGHKFVAASGGEKKKREKEKRSTAGNNGVGNSSMDVEMTDVNDRSIMVGGVTGISPSTTRDQTEESFAIENTLISEHRTSPPKRDGNTSNRGIGSSSQPILVDSNLPTPQANSSPSQNQTQILPPGLVRPKPPSNTPSSNSQNLSPVPPSSPLSTSPTSHQNTSNKFLHHSIRSPTPLDPDNLFQKKTVVVDGKARKVGVSSEEIFWDAEGVEKKGKEGRQCRGSGDIEGFGEIMRSAVDEIKVEIEKGDVLFCLRTVI
jgi:hypothetical protein